MTLAAMLADLPTACSTGIKRNAKGHNVSWIGYKLHIDTADGDIPISCLLTSASVHDSQAAIPLASITVANDQPSQPLPAAVFVNVWITACFMKYGGIVKVFARLLIG